MPRITNPDDLTRAIRYARRACDNGLLVEADDWPADQVRFMAPAFAKLPERGGWPDVFAYRFRCPSCGQGYVLTAETYHGAGGSFDRRGMGAASPI